MLQEFAIDLFFKNTGTIAWMEIDSILHLSNVS